MNETPKHSLDVVDYDVNELSHYHKNPRRGDVDAIARSLEVNGQYRPVVVNLGRKTGRQLEVLAGNHTLQAAKHLGWTTIKGTVVDVDDQQAARIVAADNRTADLGDYDNAQLAELLTGLDDLDGTGYTDDDLDALLNPDRDLETLNDDSEEYVEAWQIVVDCKDETEQERLYERLTQEGHSCRVLTL